MSVIHTCEQGTAAWRRLRVGLPTASNFFKILTPKGKASDQFEGYLYEILSELMVGHPIDMPQTEWMRRGIETEDAGVSAYEFQHDIETERIGFVTNDAMTIGASPDRGVGEDGLLQVKVPAPHTHVRYLLTGSLEDKYFPQLQGELYVSGRKWIDVISYNPEMPLAVIRVQRDEVYLAKLAKSLDEFVNLLAIKKAECIARFGPFPEPEPEPDYSRDFISEDDVEAIIAANRGAEGEQRLHATLQEHTDRMGEKRYFFILSKHGCETTADAMNLNGTALQALLDELKAEA